MGWLPPLRGVVDRRILVNFRVDPAPLADLLPAPFEPRTVDGVAIGGVCCLRLDAVRPRGVPAVLGVRSENAAHRIGVTWDEGGDRRAGVYVPRRDTDSRLTARLGARTFGRHDLADFDVRETGDRYELTIRSRTGEERLRLAATATATDDFPETSVFESLADAVEYHRCGTVGYSPSPDGERYDGLELLMDEWTVRPLAVETVRASYFEERLPASAVAFDDALLMRSVGTDMRPVASMDACEASAAAALEVEGR